MTLPDSELMREMYAEFGVTYSCSEDLCRGLATFYGLMSIKNVDDMTRPRIEEKLVEAYSLTLGQVIDRVKPLVPPDLQTRLGEALEKRNYIAHHFWYDRVYQMFSQEGLIDIINELRKYRQLFSELDGEIWGLFTQRRLELGLTDDVLETYMQRGIVGEIEDDFPFRSPLTKKAIRVVRAYNVFLENGTIAQVFETDDGRFLQFCDVGLGWSNFTKVEANWKVNERLQQYLPATVSPRPEILSPWNYEFPLPKRAVLWVRREKTENHFKWGIRTLKE
jgi:hypothetical protein